MNKYYLRIENSQKETDSLSLITRSTKLSLCVLSSLQTTTTRWLTVLSDLWHPSGKYLQNKDTLYSFSPRQIASIRMKNRLSSGIPVYHCRCRWILLLSFPFHLL